MNAPTVRIVPANRAVVLPDGTEGTALGWSLEVDGQLGPWRFTDYLKAADAQLEIFAWTDEQYQVWKDAHPRFGNDPAVNAYAQDFAACLHRDERRLRMAP